MDEHLSTRPERTKEVNDRKDLPEERGDKHLTQEVTIFSESTKEPGDGRIGARGPERSAGAMRTRRPSHSASNSARLRASGNAVLRSVKTSSDTSARRQQESAALGATATPAGRVRQRAHVVRTARA